jgi:hypothetical protein
MSGTRATRDGCQWSPAKEIARKENSNHSPREVFQMTCVIRPRSQAFEWKERWMRRLHVAQ